jgi:hypothetical protein
MKNGGMQMQRKNEEEDDDADRYRVKAYKKKEPVIVERDRRQVLEESEEQNIYQSFIPNYVSNEK